MGKIKLESNIINDKYTEYVYNTFDIQDREKTEVNIEYDLSEAKNFDWNIGVIYGSSGSGKTSLLKRIGDLSSSTFNENKPLISNFNWLEPKEVTMLLTSIGLSSVPTWLRPFKLLSNGEQYRAELAYKIAKANNGEVILIDEYTSVVDRDVAKAMSFALQKYVRRINKRIILASCHYDIMEWLMPDWTCAPQKGGVLEKGEWLRKGKPEIKLQISRVEVKTWEFFKKHHYLTEKINKSSKCFLFEWNDKPVGFVSVLNMPSGTLKNAVRGSRTVVLPDFQGLGIGSKMSDFIGSIFRNNGNRYFTKTVNPALGEYRNGSDKWKPTSKNGRVRYDNKERDSEQFGWSTIIRSSYCHEYIGDDLDGYSDILLPINEMRDRKTN